MVPSRASMLEEEFESRKLDVWLVVIRPLVAVRAPSTDAEDPESCVLEV